MRRTVSRFLELLIVLGVATAFVLLWRSGSQHAFEQEGVKTDWAARAVALAKEHRLAEDPAVASARAPVYIDPIGTYSLLPSDRAVGRVAPSYVRKKSDVLRLFSSTESDDAGQNIWDVLQGEDVYCWAYILDGRKISVVLFRGRSGPEKAKTKTIIDGGSL